MLAGRNTCLTNEGLVLARQLWGAARCQAPSPMLCRISLYQTPWVGSVASILEEILSPFQGTERLNCLPVVTQIGSV